MELKHLIETINRKLSQIPYDQNKNFETRYYYILNDPMVQKFIEWEIPLITNLSDKLELNSGKIDAIREDLFEKGIGLKKPVVGSLLVRHLIQMYRAKRIPEGIIDGGNVNTGLALSYFANKFHIKAALVHSRYFPDYIKSYLKKNSSGNLDLIEAPALNMGREREFYKYLVNIVRSDPLYRNFICLWHAKYSGRSILPLGKKLADSIKQCPDFIVLTLGAGSTLEGIALPIKKKFQGKPKLIIIEHEYSPLLRKTQFKELSFDFMLSKKFSDNWIVTPPKGIPHAVLGPHYDDTNPLLNKSILEEVDYIFSYTDKQWKWMASYCRNNNLSIGNSSSANLVVSRAIAECKYNVLTVIYEPFRPFYEKKAPTT